MEKQKFIVAIIILLYLITGCSNFSQIDREQNKWKRMGIENYHITIKFYENFANNLTTHRNVAVENNQITSSSCIADKCPTFVFVDAYTIADLFAIARGSTLSSIGMLDDYNDCVKSIEFDETYGFPRSMRFDCPGAIDEEHSFRVLSFSPS